MKSDNNKLDFEQMLRTVEHAGRDARRQERLAEMIDQMAEAESVKRERGMRWWVSRLATAACLLFFISTAVRIWFIPTSEPQGRLVAVVEADRLPAVQADNLQPQQPANKTVHRTKPVARPKNTERYEFQEFPDTSKISEIIEEFYAEVSAEEIEKEPLVIEQDFAVAPIVEEQPAEPVAIAQTTPAPVPEPDVSKPTRRSFFGSLFRQAEPSKMDGTMLAINIL